MTDPKDKPDNEPMPSPTWKPSPPEMDLEPIPLPERTDESPLGNGDDLPGEGLVPAVPSRDEANMEPDEALPDDAEEEILNDDPAREKIRFDEEIPKSSR
ncbi:hypothetical protein QO004_003248 [Rhizobium mesoamericanum]|uniref:hypothetical protein n=1 Tax=Rhizobium mesoamericanum TaxID=1079800 RepID=UPI00278BA5F2|nr:hypothetical protein [Rhizobium mesoamericanum]MDQ0561454.1 hypothetical protein [Rhizobium mesoamericanum]